MKPKTVGRSGGRMAALPPENSTGLMADSIILTAKGEMAVADLEPGQRVITRDSGTAIVKSIRRRRIVGQAVRIKAGSLGHTRPDRDVTLPAGQNILVRDWRAQAMFGVTCAMVPAHQLVDGEYISLLGITSMDVLELEFDQPHVLYVDGLEVASHPDAATSAIAA